ncbi:MAG: hypothetical protein JXM74_05020 [Fusobacteriaceae bacterium]|nr:hypothetical protein [Fusobacteriaceae bacterium]
MKKSLLLLVLLLQVGCNSVKYRSISKPAVEKPNNEYFTSDKNQKYEGNSSVTDINSKSNKYQTIVVENDGTYYYLD